VGGGVPVVLKYDLDDVVDYAMSTCACGMGREGNMHEPGRFEGHRAHSSDYIRRLRLYLRNATNLVLVARAG